MRKIYFFLIVSISLLVFASCNNDEDTNGDKNINVLDKIKDPVFKGHIEFQIKTGVLKTATAGILTTTEAATLKSISFTSTANRRNLISLEGIEYFIGLEILRLNFTAVELLTLVKI